MRRDRHSLRPSLHLLLRGLVALAWLPTTAALSGQEPASAALPAPPGAVELHTVAAPQPVATLLSFPEARQGHAEGAQRGGGGGRGTPLVLIVPDRLGPDLRAEAYVVQLLGAGIAVLEVVAGEAADAAAALDPAAHALAGDPRIDAARIGVLGFGAGGLAAAAAGMPFRARALLYPGCPVLLRMLPDMDPSSWNGSALLLVHGDADSVNPWDACAAFVETIGRRHAVAARRISYAGASYAWDLPGFRPATRSFLPAPDGHAGGRVEVVPWPGLAAMSATQVAAFFVRAFAETRE